MQQQSLLLSGGSGGGGVDGRVLHDNDVQMDDSMDGGDVVVVDASSGVGVSAMQGLE